jgi:hypothetical protein
MKLKIEITMDGAAFKPECNIEAAHILRDLADELEEGEDLLPGYRYPLSDENGNNVGEAKVTR